MNSRYFERVKVETYLKTVHCPNGDCEGKLTSDGKQRSTDGLHGGTPEYRHICNICNAGAWLPDQYPKVEYVPAEEKPQSANVRNVPSTV